MKIVTDNAVYIQNKDIIYLSRINVPVPSSLFNQIYNDDIVIIDDLNGNGFVKLDKDSEIQFFKSLDWIVDYQNVKDLNIDDFKKLKQKIINEKNQIANQYNSMSDKERKENINIVNRFDLLEYKLQSLKEILNYKLGQLDIKMPKEVLVRKR